MINFEDWSDIISMAPLGCMQGAVLCFLMGLVLYYGRVRAHIHAVGVRVSSFRSSWCFPTVLIDCIKALRFYRKCGRAAPLTLRLEIILLGSFFVLLSLAIITAWGSSFLSVESKERQGFIGDRSQPLR